MENKYLNKPAPPYQLKLYCFIGEAMCSIQLLEDALSHYFVIKKFGKITEEEANRYREKYRLHTLGQAIKFLKKERLFHEVIQNNLESLLDERNWLVHRIFHEFQEDPILESQITNLFSRIKATCIKARETLHLMDEDVMKYSESNGVDMSRTREARDKFYSEV